MDKRKLLIAEGTEEFRLALAEALRGVYHVRQCGDGTRARELLESFRPDVVVLDLMLPGIDGLSLLHWAASRELCPGVLATTSFVSDYVLHQAEQLGIGCLLRKPCDISGVVGHLNALGAVRKPRITPQPDCRSQAAGLLLALGVPTKLRGYGYLREAAVLMMERPTQSITKELYPEVARICGCAPEHVERSIRSAITAAWERRDPQLWRLYFPAHGKRAESRPSNGAFLTRLAESLREEFSVPCGL